MSFLQKIKQAFSKSPGVDDKPYPIGKCGYNGKTGEFIRLLPYGISSLEPVNSFILLINSQGQEAVKYGIPSAMKLRKKSLKQGEVAIYNSNTGVYVYLKEDGTVEINSNTNIIGDLTVTGDMQINGALNVTGAASLNTVTCNSISINGIDFGTHVHSGVDTGTSNTGGPL